MSMRPYRDGITIPFCTCDHLGTIRFRENECVIPLSEGTLEN